MVNTIPIVLYLTTNKRTNRMSGANLHRFLQESKVIHISTALITTTKNLSLDRYITVVVGTVDMWISGQNPFLLSSLDTRHLASRALSDHVDKLFTCQQ